MSCCVLCGEPFELGQKVLKLTTYVVEWGGPVYPGPVFVPAKFRDETVERFVHEKCASVHEVPPLLTGDDPNWRHDV